MVAAMSAALVLAACGDDSDDEGAADTGAAASGGAAEGDCVVGVSWNNYQEERWAKWDEPALKEAIEAGGGSYISNDAKSSAETQATNVENLISQGANVLVILAQDGTAIMPSVEAAIGQGIPVIAYDRLIEDPEALYITFDNIEVGRMQARAILEAVPSGNYVIIKGNQADANADFLREVEVTSQRRGDYKRVYNEVFNRYRERVELGIIGTDDEGTPDGEALAMLSALRQAASLCKIDTALEIANEVLEQGQGVVLFAEFVETAKILAEQLRVPAYTGARTKDERWQIVQDFQAGKTKAFVATGAAGGIGLNLTAGSTVIMVDRPLTPGDAEQQEDRLHRIGQHWPVTSIWLQAFAIDHAIDRILQEKAGRIHEFHTGQPKENDTVTVSKRALSARNLLAVEFRGKS
jgi:hypothetical protein